MAKLNALLSTGPSGNGKTTLLVLAGQLLDEKRSGRMVVIDNREIIKWAMKQQTPLGAALRACAAKLMGSGKLIPDELVIPTFLTWLEHIRAEHPELRIVLVSGMPRTFGQSEVAKSTFARSLVVNINATREQTLAATMHRASTADVVREDDAGGLRVFETRWAEYMNETVPMLQSLNGTALHLERAVPLADRLRSVLDFLKEHPRSPIETGAVLRALHLLNNVPGHPVNRKIREIEAPRRGVIGRVSRLELATA